MTLTISVVTAVFNRVDTVGEALASVRAQDWPQVEHIVIDGGSTDGTLDVLMDAQAQLATLVSEPDRGIYDALNKGLAFATGDVVGFLHADDVYESPQTLSQVARAFDDPAVEAVYGDLVYTRRSDPGQVVRYWQAGEFCPKGLARGWMPPHPTLYVRRSVYRRLGVFDTAFRISADYDMVLRLLGSGRVNPAYVPQVLVRMRLGGISNRSLATLLQKSREDLAAMRKNGVGGLAALFRKNFIKLPQFVVRSPGSQTTEVSGRQRFP